VRERRRADHDQCGDAEGPCTNQDYCDDAGGCHDNGFKSATTPCGSSSNTNRDDPDTCDGAGSCEANNEPTGTACDDGSFRTVAATCSSGACGGGSESFEGFFQPVDNLRVLNRVKAECRAGEIQRASSPTAAPSL